jgi:DNA-binding NarL/FixJ family response regulator
MGSGEPGRVVRVASVDEDQPARHGVAGWLAIDSSIIVTGSAPTVAALLDDPGRDADVVLLAAGVVLLAAGRSDCSLLSDSVRQLIETGHTVVVTTATPSSRLAQIVFGAGASGLLSRSAPATAAVRAIHAAAEGHAVVPVPIVQAMVGSTEVRLSPQESTAARLYAEGRALTSVASQMQLSPQTVKQYIDRARLKYRVAGRACPTKVHLYQRLLEDGLMEPGPESAGPVTGVDRFRPGAPDRPPG